MTTLASITCSDDGTITTFTVDTDELTPKATSAIGKGVAALAPDASGTRAFAGVKDPVGIVSLELDAASGQWRQLGHTPTESSMTYLTLSGDGRFLVGVSYGGGWGAVWPVEGEGLGAPTARVEHRNLHCVVERDGFCYFVSLGEDLIACHRLEADGSLAPLEIPTVSAPEGSGPRHLVIDESGKNLYCVTEFSGEVLRFDRDPATGTLVAAEKVAIFAPDRGLRHSVFGADPVKEHYIWGADVHLAGGVLIASERCESTLAVVGLREGKLGEVVQIVDTEKQPRGFIVSGDASWVLCPGEKSDQVSLFSLVDGKLARVAQAPNGLGGNWVRLLEL